VVNKESSESGVCEWIDIRIGYLLAWLATGSKLIMRLDGSGCGRLLYNYICFDRWLGEKARIVIIISLFSMS
jgi:hypothetical protein